jgi:hypothetical protein
MSVLGLYKPVISNTILRSCVPALVGVIATATEASMMSRRLRKKGAALNFMTRSSMVGSFSRHFWMVRSLFKPSTSCANFICVPGQRPSAGAASQAMKAALRQSQPSARNAS